jgi:hypothetical protein
MATAAGEGSPSDAAGAAGNGRGGRVVRPIFIIGAPRSGTSITTWALGQHPNIQSMPETAWIASLAVGSVLSHAKGSERGRYSHLSNVEFPLDRFMARIGEAVDAVVHDAYADRCRRVYGEASTQAGWQLSPAQLREPMHIRRRGDDPKQRWIDGTPMNSFFIAALAKLFPHARFIHNLRRPDEVATSLEGFDQVGAEPQSLKQGLATWVAHTENAWYAERGMGRERVFRLDFHRLAQEPEALFRELCGFLDEPFSADCLLPLQRKVNSSEVDDKRAKNLALLRESRAFSDSQAVYDAVSQRPPGDETEALAMQVLEQRLADYCHGRSIV